MQQGLFQDIVEAVVSHAASTGYFEKVNFHEPKNPPGYGLSCAAWIQSIVPQGNASSLIATGGRILLNIRIYGRFLEEPQDAIDPQMFEAVNALYTAYHGDFTLDGLVRNVDVLGEFGIPLTMQAGYLEMSKGMHRIMHIELPLIVSDMWVQTP